MTLLSETAFEFELNSLQPKILYKVIQHCVALQKFIWDNHMPFFPDIRGY